MLDVSGGPTTCLRSARQINSIPFAFFISGSVNVLFLCGVQWVEFFRNFIKKEKENSRVWKNVYEVWVSVVVSTFTYPTPFLKLSHNVCSLNLEFAEFRHAFNGKRIFKNDSASMRISGLLGLKKAQTKQGNRNIITIVLF